MVSPVTGPFVKTDFRANIGNPTVYDFYIRREKYKQAKPVNGLPLPYVMSYGQAIGRGGDMSTCAEWVIDPGPDNQAATVAYERLKDSISSRAQGGVFVAEWSKSCAMIADRATQLLLAFRKIRKGDFGGAARTLKISTPKGATTRQNWASNYLEFHFGWAPMVGDIYNAIDVLQNPLKGVKVHASARNSYPERGYPPPGAYSRGKQYTTLHRVRYGLEVSVNNPNLWLANQLGLINPATVAWELVPFSFVVDWFVNVSQFLETGTDFVGLNILKPYTTSFNEASIHNYWSNYSWTSDLVQKRMQRIQGISAPTLGLKPAKIWHWRRAAAAISLLSGFLR
jgi:hypothetical protein